MAEPRDYGFGDDEKMLRDQARRFLDEHGSVEKLRTLVARDHAIYEKGETPEWDRSAWSKIVELGFAALAVPEECGGAGAKTVAVAAVVEEIGAHAFPSPLVATLFATYALRGASTESADAWLGKIAEGSTAALAITDRHASWDLSRTDVEARSEGDGLVLEGVAAYVQDAAKADFFVVSVRHQGSIALVAVPKDAKGVSVTRDRIVDLTRDQGRVRFDRVFVPASDVVAPAPKGLAALHEALPAILVLVAADLAGTCEWQLRTTAEYARVREQFGKPIGSFQAVKHPIVNMMVGIDMVRSLVYDAACACDHTPERALVAARMAKAKASDVAQFCSGRSVQLHGGIGFTWECDVHLFFKRNQHNQFLFGDGAHHRTKLAEVLVGPLGG